MYNYNIFNENYVGGKIVKLVIKMLNAFYGDSFLITCIDDSGTKNIIVDGGISRTYTRTLRNEIEKIEEKKQNIDLMFITHVDEDHIGGIISFFEDECINKSIVKKVVFNSAKSISNFLKTEYDSNREINIKKITDKKVSYSQGKTLENELIKLGLLEDRVWKTGDEIKLGQAIIKILTPRKIELKKLNKHWIKESSYKRKASARENDYDKTISELILENTYKKDNSIANRSSISFLLEYGSFKVLMLGDSRSDVVTKSLKRLDYSTEKKLVLDFVKLPHHGSEKNTFYDLLDIIECKKYIISTDGSIFNHPDKKTFSRILNKFSNVEFYFNYDVYESIFSNVDCEEYKFTCYKENVMELSDERDI